MYRVARIEYFTFLKSMKIEGGNSEIMMQI